MKQKLKSSQEKLSEYKFLLEMNGYNFDDKGEIVNKSPVEPKKIKDINKKNTRKNQIN